MHGTYPNSIIWRQLICFNEISPHTKILALHIVLVAGQADVCLFLLTYEPVHESSNNVVCATSKASDQPAHTRSLIRAFASHLSILWLLSYWLTQFGVSKLKRRLHRLVWVYICQNATLLEISCTGSYYLVTRITMKEGVHIHETFIYYNRNLPNVSLSFISQWDPSSHLLPSIEMYYTGGL